MKIQESAEMYLETIYLLTERIDEVRSIDIARQLGYSKPSVSRAVGLLKGEGLLEMADNGALSLTEKGRAKAEKIFERHKLLTSFFESIGVSPSAASDDACKIEHVISDETVNTIKEFLKKH